MGRRSLLIGAVVLTGVVLWIVALEQRPPRSPPEKALPVGPSAPPAPESRRNPGAGPDRATQPETAESEQARKPEHRAAAPTAPSQAPAAPQQPEDPAPVPPPKASGPIAELKYAFETEPRDSAAQLPESRIESEFRKSDIPPGMLKSVLCRKSVCKVAVLWAPETGIAFMSAFTRLSADFEPDIALDPHGTAAAGQKLQVDVYLPRLGSGAKPSER
jgi:hypothetical protein